MRRSTPMSCNQRYLFPHFLFSLSHSVQVTSFVPRQVRASRRPIRIPPIPQRSFATLLAMHFNSPIAFLASALCLLTVSNDAVAFPIPSQGVEAGPITQNQSNESANSGIPLIPLPSTSQSSAVVPKSKPKLTGTESKISSATSKATSSKSKATSYKSSASSSKSKDVSSKPSSKSSKHKNEDKKEAKDVSNIFL